jgi:hypothetical protein
MLLECGNCLHMIGGVMAFAGSACWLGSMGKGERRTSVIPLVLLLAYVALSFMMV